jgi:restriction endonuclease S subunit
MSQFKQVKVGASLEKIPRQSKVKKSDYQIDGALPVIDQGKDYIAGYTDDPKHRYNGPLPLTIFGDHTRILKWVDRPFAVGADGTQLLRGDEGFNQRFFYYALCSLEIENFGYERHFKYLKDEEIPCPDLPTQKKIAGILSAYDDLIENNLRRIKILEDMAQSLYREWFVQFRFPGHENVKFVDSPTGKIPEGWEVKKLGDIAEDVRRGIPKGKLGQATPYVGLEHIPRKSLALDDWETVTELGSNKLTFEPGEILFGKIRPYFHKVSVAPFHGICSADTIVIRPKEPAHAALVTAVVSSEGFVAHASATANGAKMPRANWKVLVDYTVVDPPAELLEKFSSFFENVIFEQQVLIQKNQNLQKTRDLLLPKLLN